jgi:hypothetical protein
VLLPKAPLAPSVIVAGLLPSGGRRSALDVFLSYATEDRLKAASLVKLFEEAGWEVWWDRAIGPGEEWEPAVLEHLRRARCVVVLWSRASVGKAWVRREAAEAEANGTLVPVLLQPAGLPNPTPRIQALRLATWEGAGTSELQELLEAVRARSTSIASSGWRSRRPRSRSARSRWSTTGDGAWGTRSRRRS